MQVFIDRQGNSLFNRLPLKGRVNTVMRPSCSKCNAVPCAVNYHRKGKIHYRKLCEGCWKKHKKESLPKHPRWFLAGYRMKPTCENCGYIPTLPEQLTVFYIDNNREHISVTNLVTLCLNCNVEIIITGWNRGDLLEDL